MPERRNLAAPAVAAFVMFGLPDGMIGVAWPAIRAGLGLPLDRLGVLMVASTAGYLLTSAGSGLMVRRLGTGVLVLAAGMIALVGSFLLGCGTGPVFPALTSLTPERVGPTWAPHLIGWQLGAGAVGAAVVSSAFGISLQRAGLQLTGPLLTGLAVVVTGFAIALDRIGAQPVLGVATPAASR